MQVRCWCELGASGEAVEVLRELAGSVLAGLNDSRMFDLVAVDSEAVGGAEVVEQACQEAAGVHGDLVDIGEGDFIVWEVDGCSLANFDDIRGGEINVEAVVLVDGDGQGSEPG